MSQTSVVTGVTSGLLYSEVECFCHHVVEDHIQQQVFVIENSKTILGKQVIFLILVCQLL